MFVVYSKPQCPYCDQAKALLKIKGLDYREVILDVGQSKEEGKTYMPVQDFKSQYPLAKTVPQIFKGVIHIGGFNELKKHLSESEP